MDSLKVIYDRSYGIIRQLSTQKRKISEVSSIIPRFDLSKFDALYGSFSTSAKVVITTIVANVLIGFKVRTAVTATVAGGAAYLGARGGLALIGGPIAVALGIGITVVPVVRMASWSRESFWKSMAKKVRLAIVDQESFNQMIKEVQEMLESSILEHYLRVILQDLLLQITAQYDYS
jgi:hypothetical protein